MRDKHEPHGAFVERLEWQIAGEVRRRNRPAEPPRWPLRSRRSIAVAAAGLALVSMGLGGAVVAAAYRAQNSEQRDQVAAVYQLRLALAQKTLAAAADTLRLTERNVSIGMATQTDALEAQSKVSGAQAGVRSLELQLEEVRLTGREPSNEISSPLVSGRDFVGERLRNDITVPRNALSIAQRQLLGVQRRVDVGVADATDLDVARAKVVELQAAVVGFERKIEIRQRFLKGEIDSVQADLRVLEGEAEQRRSTLAPKVDLARRQVDQTARRVKVGVAQSVDLAEATLRLQQLEADLAKADLDLAVIRRRLAGGD